MKKQSKKLNIAVLLLIISFALAIALVSTNMQNKKLKNQINDFNREYEKGVMDGVNDFTLLIIDKLKTCQPVTLMAEQQSATVIDVACGVKE